MIINFKIKPYLYLTFYYKKMHRILIRNLGKLPGPSGIGPDLSKIGPKSIGPQVNNTHFNPNPPAASNTIKPTIDGCKNSNPPAASPTISEDNNSMLILSTNNWTNSSISEKIDPTVVPVKNGVQFLWTGNSSDATPSESTAASGEQELLDLAENFGLTTYEKTDKTEGAGYGGSPKLTKSGIASYSANAKPKIINKEDIILKDKENNEDFRDKNSAPSKVTSKEDVKDVKDVKDVTNVEKGKIYIPFKSGLLASHPSNIILLPSQTHLVIIYCPKQDKYIGIGTLTSEKACVFLAPAQIYNPEKRQFFRYFPRPKVVDAKDFQENPDATTFVNQPHIQEILKAMAKQFLNKSSTLEVYDSKTVTPEMLATMIESEKNKETNKETKAQSVGPSEQEKNKDIELNDNKDIVLDDNKDNFNKHD